MLIRKSDGSFRGEIKNSYKFAISFERLVIFNMIVFIDCKMMIFATFSKPYTLHKLTSCWLKRRPTKKVAILYFVLYHFSAYTQAISLIQFTYNAYSNLDRIVAICTHLEIDYMAALIMIWILILKIMLSISFDNISWENIKYHQR